MYTSVIYFYDFESFKVEKNPFVLLVNRKCIPIDIMYFQETGRLSLP